MRENWHLQIQPQIRIFYSQRWTRPGMRFGPFFVEPHKIVILKRSASQSYRVTQALGGAESKDLDGAYRAHAARSFSTTEARSWRTHHGLSQQRKGWRFEKKLKPHSHDPSRIRSCSRASWSKSSERHGHDRHRRGPSTPRHLAPVSRDNSVRRSAQDDDFVVSWREAEFFCILFSRTALAAGVRFSHG